MGKRAKKPMNIPQRSRRRRPNVSAPQTSTAEQVMLLQNALGEAIRENQILRSRVMELEALLVAAQMREDERRQQQHQKQSDSKPTRKSKRILKKQAGQSSP